MLVVMEQGYATRAGATAVPAGQRGGGAEGQGDAFQDVVVRDLIPTIDATYRTLSDRRHRAIAGLSMGAGQAVRIGFGNRDLFASVGAFSGGAGGGRGVAFDRQTAYNGVMADAAAFNRNFDLFWIGFGDLEGGYANARNLHKTLEAAGIKHVWFETVGSHEWQVWRKSLNDFAPRLFRESAGTK